MDDRAMCAECGRLDRDCGLVDGNFLCPDCRKKLKRGKSYRILIPIDYGADLLQNVADAIGDSIPYSYASDVKEATRAVTDNLPLFVLVNVPGQVHGVPTCKPLSKTGKYLSVCAMEDAGIEIREVDDDRS